MRKQILFLLLLFLVTNCKSRQTQKSASEVNITTTQEGSTNESLTDKSTEKKNTEASKEGVKESSSVVLTNGMKLTPVDKDKPIIVEDSQGKKTSISNAIIESGQSKSESTTKEASAEKIKAEETKQANVKQDKGTNQRQKAKAKIGSSDKITKSEPFSIWSYWWLILLLIIGIVARVIYKRIKTPLKPI